MNVEVDFKTDYQFVYGSFMQVLKYSVMFSLGVFGIFEVDIFGVIH